MAWIEQRGTRYRVRMRMPDGSVGTDSSHPTRAAAELRCKQVDVERALDTYLDPTRGRITLAAWVAIWEPGHLAGEARWAAYRSHLRNHPPAHQPRGRRRTAPPPGSSHQPHRPTSRRRHNHNNTTVTIMCSQFAPNVRSRNETARYHDPG